MTTLARIREHWPEYAMEAWALGMFMILAGFVTILVEHPDLALRRAIDSELLRRALIGIAMGTTAVALIYSPWGRRSGAHMNPAVTLGFLALGRIARVDAFFYIAAQFVGGLAGVVTMIAVFGERFTDMPVNFVATLPANDGAGLAFALEFAISCGLMATVLVFSNHSRLMSYAGVAAGLLVAVYITFEGPFSGMSMNPARTAASAIPAGLWRDLWIYFTAPPLGMLAAALLYRRIAARPHCAKVYHAADTRCIHCGYEPLIGSLEEHEQNLVA